MNEDVLKKNVSEKITFYRKAAGLTQLELAEKLNYSDKSVSKWERGDGLPDITVLTNMAELFGVSVDDFVSSAPPKKPIKLTKKHTLIPALSVGLVWLVATFVFCACRGLSGSSEKMACFYLRMSRQLYRHHGFQLPLVADGQPHNFHHGNDLDPCGERRHHPENTQYVPYIRSCRRASDFGLFMVLADFRPTQGWKMSGGFV